MNQTEIKPGGYFDDIMDLGTDGYRFDDLFLAGDVNAEGTVKTTAGLAWDLGGYTAGAPTADGYLTVAVEGVTYRVAVDKQ